MTFCLEYPISNIKPASYNPRIIDEQTLETLRESLKTLGMTKPIIVTSDGVLLAGHQRTCAMQSMEWTHCPAFVLDKFSIQDEIRFNQLHNASDLEFSENVLIVPPQSQLGYVDIEPSQINGCLRAKHAIKRDEILSLLSKHGPWGSITVSQSGKVLVSSLYAMASKILGFTCKAYVVRDDQVDTVLKYFSQQYGKFSYQHLPRTTWAQALCQRPRLRKPAIRAKEMRSRLYEGLVIPRLKKKTRILDFGSGRMDYVKHLKSLGYSITGIEFYLRKGNTYKINVSQVNNDIEYLCNDLQQNGLYDLVICDSVINSVDSKEASQDILTSLSAFCKPGGTVIFSGRSREETDRKNSSEIKTGRPRYVLFFDDDGFSAMFADGVWRYQKLHTIEEVRVIAPCYFGSSFQIYELADKPVLARNFLASDGWAVVATKQIELPMEQRRASLSREFDLPLPGGRRYGRSQDILRAYEAALSH